MAKVKVAFSEEELARLAKKPAVAASLGKYVRHVQRIHTLERVLDPKDTKARLAKGTGTPKSVQEEIDRRATELPKLEKTLRAALA